MGLEGYGVCVHRSDNNIHETGIARIDFINDEDGDLFYVLLTFFSMFLLMYIDIRNRYRFQKSGGEAGGAVILPGYFTFLTTVAVVNLVFGVIFLVGYLCHNHFGRWTNLNLMSIQFGFMHFFYETPTFFFLCNGAGKRDILWAVRGGAAVGVAAFLFLYIAGYYGLIEHCYETPFYIFISFRLTLILAYVFIVAAPTTILYQRPALIPYSRFMLLYNLGWLFVNFSLFFGPDYFYCSAYFVNFLFDGLFPPLVIYYAFVNDSQYWQGCLALDNNPLAGVWDVDSAVVSAMASAISQTSAVTEKRIPVIHYGMINIDIGQGFRAGGFSRVYAADFKERRVAVKLLFAMELTPKSIVMFYKEAQILQDLQSEYVVECVGITLMPPAIGVVMEYCGNGSLFDFLYDNKEGFDNYSTLKDTLRTGESDLKLTIAGHFVRNSAFTTNSTNISSFSIAAGPMDDCDHVVLSTTRRSPGAAFNPMSPPPSHLHTNGTAASGPSRQYIERGSALTPSFSSRGDISLKSLAESARSITFDMMLDAVSGLAFMHSKGYMHCDVKSLNYLVTYDLRVKLSDLGEARPIEKREDGLQCPVPAVNWCPPECLAADRTGDSYSPASDVFSLSMVLSEILLRELPLNSIQPNMTYMEWKSLIVDQSVRPTLPDVIPVTLREVFAGGWSTNPDDRPAASQYVDVLKDIVRELRAGPGKCDNV